MKTLLRSWPGARRKTRKAHTGQTYISFYSREKKTWYLQWQQNRRWVDVTLMETRDKTKNPIKVGPWQWPSACFLITPQRRTFNSKCSMTADSSQHCTAFSRSCVASVSLKHAHEHTNVKNTHKTPHTILPENEQYLRTSTHRSRNKKPFQLDVQCSALVDLRSCGSTDCKQASRVWHVHM